MQLVDGVIKYQLDFETADPVEPGLIKEINIWRNILHRLDLVGHYKTVYQGAGYGNISRRLNDTGEFVITASHTGEISRTNHTHYVLVTESTIEKNHLTAKGPSKPSSEALSHAAIYKALPNINYVFHVHSAAIWKHTEQLNIPATSPDIAYGTVEMAQEIMRLCQTDGLKGGGILSMGGHQDGVIAFGETATYTGTALVQALAAAELES